MFRFLNRSRVSRRAARPAFTKISRLEQLEPRLVLNGGSFWQPPAWGPTVTTVAAATQVVTLSPTADASVNATNPYTNYGGATNLLVQNDSSPSVQNDAEAYLKFSASGITGPVLSAVLVLTPLSVGQAASSMTVGVALLSDQADGWVEGSGGASGSTNTAATGPITWYNSPYGSGSIAVVAGAQLVADQSISINVTSLVNQRFNQNGIDGFIVGVVSRDGAGQWVNFASQENGIVGYRPELLITTTGPVAAAPTIATQPYIVSQTSTSVQLSALGADASGESNLAYTWSLASSTSTVAPTYSSNGTNASKNTTVTFQQAGTYVFAVTAKNTVDGLSVSSNTVTVTVAQTLNGIQITPSNVTLYLGATQQYAAVGVDQFGQAISGSLTGVVWAMTGAGTFNSTTDTYTAPTTSASGTTAAITATAGSYSAKATVSITTAYLGLQDPTLATLLQSLDADGSISRTDMMTIIGSVEKENNGVLSAADFHDLKTILSDAAALDIPGYVQVLAGDVINGNTANAHYLGATLGNLAVGSTATQLNDLLDKWFLGTDLPATGGYSYQAVSSTVPLFSTAGPSHKDEEQGDLGDCYLISSLGAIADSVPSAIKNMIVANGDGTYTVRFYDNGVADYVTVNDMLPTDGKGNLVFDGEGFTTSNLVGYWIALVEKAYAQWDETGKEGRSGLNSYVDIEGGWMADVDAQVLGHAASSYNMTSTSDEQALVAGMTGKEAVTIGTDTSNASNDSLSYGLYGSHAYAVIGYNSSNGTFTLYNPWGVDQPTQALTWAQLQTVCDGFVVANAAGTSSFASSAAAQFMLRPAVASRPVAATASAASDSSANLDTTATPQSGQDAAKGLAPAIDAVWSQCGSGFVPGSSASPFGLSSSIGNLYRGSEVGSGVQSQTPSDLSAAAVDELLKTWAND